MTQPLKSLKVSLLLVLFLAIFILGQAASPHATQAQALQPNLCITGTPNIRYFPNIGVQFRSLDARLRSVPNLNQSAFIIQDADTMPSISNLSTNPSGVGLNLYFVIDQGNRTDAQVVKAVLTRYAEMFMAGTTSEPGIDRVTIVTSLPNSKRDNPIILLEPTQSKTDVFNAIQSLPDDDPINQPKSGLSAIQNAINLIRADGYGCTRPNIIIAIMGEDVEYRGGISFLATEALSTSTYINIIHTPHQRAYGDAQDFMTLAQSTFGAYYQISSSQLGNEFSLLDPTLFADISSQRLLYSLEFRSLSNDNGQRSLIVDTNNPIIQTASNTTTYTVNLQPPTVTLTSPINDTVIKRTSTSKPVSGGYLFDVNTVNVEFQVSWGDGYPRDIDQYEVAVDINSTGAQTSEPIVSETSQGYQFEYDLRPVEVAGSNPVSLVVSVIDEFGLTGTSAPINLRVENIVPLDQGPDPTAIAEEIAQGINNANKQNRWQLYALYAVVAALLLVLILLRRQIKKLATTGLVGQVVGQVRKTLVGGLRKGKHLAKLRVIDGPSELLNQELIITTETVRLGRDPAQADYTFFSNSSSSISGLHCRLERNNGHWRLVALSKSGSETFLDESPIPFFEPVPINNGQMIRMGYYAQQPVKLEFITVASAPGDDPRTTDISPDAPPMPIVRFPRGEEAPSESPDDSDDSLFSKYRKDK